MGFENPIIGGKASLIREAIQSPNFSLAGRVGWSIDKNGNAFFFGSTVSGLQFEINSNGMFLYFGTPAQGNLAIAIAAGAGTDRFGNAYPDGVSLSVNGGIGNEIQLRPSKDAIFVYAG